MTKPLKSRQIMPAPRGMRAIFRDPDGMTWTAPVVVLALGSDGFVHALMFDHKHGVDFMVADDAANFVKYDLEGE